MTSPNSSGELKPTFHGVGGIPDIRFIARSAYFTYKSYMERVGSDPMPNWDQLFTAEQDAWEAVITELIRKL